MGVAGWFAAAMIVVLAVAWLQETTGWPMTAADWVYDRILSVFCAMMKHANDPRYDYQPRRYR